MRSIVSVPSEHLTNAGETAMTEEAPPSTSGIDADLKDQLQEVAAFTVRPEASEVVMYVVARCLAHLERVRAGKFDEVHAARAVLEVEKVLEACRKWWTRTRREGHT
jgi:hypothetical protein